METFENRLNRALTSLSKRASQHRSLTHQYRSPDEQDIIDQVRYHVIRGNSMLKGPIRRGDVSMDDVIDAMKGNRCISSRERDIGSTNLETIISTAIHDIFEPGEVNYVRKIFGLKPTKVNPE